MTLALGGRPVLRDIDLAIGAGLFVGLLGANGAGKTTLLRAVLGLVRPARGSIAVLGRPATRGNAAVGYVPQTHAAMGAAGRLSARDVVRAAASGGRWGPPLPGAAARRDVERVLALVDAAALAERPIGELSGGERQRVRLAQALLGTPRLLLLDEPLAGLDPNHQAAVVALTSRIQRVLGITVLFSAHELNPLIGALDRVLYLGNRRAAIGTVDEVVTPSVLSRLYDAPVDVVRSQGRVFVVAGGAAPL